MNTIKKILETRGYEIKDLENIPLPKPKRMENVKSISAYYVKATSKTSCTLDDFVINIVYNDDTITWKVFSKEYETIEEAMDRFIYYSWK